MHKYPKLLGIALSSVLAYMLYHYGVFDVLSARLNGHGYVSLFIGGMLFSFGFTSPFAIAIFVELSSSTHAFFGALVAGTGALLADMGIFEFVRFSLRDELDRLASLRFFRWIYHLLHHETVSERLRLYLLWSIAGIVIASPLPDEIGVTLLGSAQRIDSRAFAILCFAMNTIGIFLILLAAQVANV